MKYGDVLKAELGVYKTMGPPDLYPRNNYTNECPIRWTDTVVELAFYMYLHVAPTVRTVASTVLYSTGHHITEWIPRPQPNVLGGGWHRSASRTHLLVYQIADHRHLSYQIVSHYSTSIHDRP